MSKKGGVADYVSSRVFRPRHASYHPISLVIHNDYYCTTRPCDLPEPSGGDMGNCLCLVRESYISSKSSAATYSQPITKSSRIDRYFLLVSTGFSCFFFSSTGRPARSRAITSSRFLARVQLLLVSCLPFAITLSIQGRRVLVPAARPMLLQFHELLSVVLRLPCSSRHLLVIHCTAA
jgi:hypothetical protein